VLFVFFLGEISYRLGNWWWGKEMNKMESGSKGIVKEIGLDSFSKPLFVSAASVIVNLLALLLAITVPQIRFLAV
jgi:hypothetical protein